MTMPSQGEDWAEWERRILERRAQRLAAAPASDAEGELLELLAFRVGSQRLALPLAGVRGVVALSGYTRVPGAARELLGVIPVRGEFRPLVSLQRLLQLPPDDGEPRYALLCPGMGAPALAVDEVDAVIRVPRRQVLPADRAAVRSCRVEGILTDGTMLLRQELLSNEEKTP